MDSNLPARRKSLVLAFVVVAMLAAGCAYSGYFDPAFGDRHAWDAHADSTYRRWEREQQIVHVDYARRTRDEQWAYWNWRHSNPLLADTYRHDEQH